MREEKMEQLRIHQEERVRKALERAKAEPKKQVRPCHDLFLLIVFIYIQQMN